MRDLKEAGEMSKRDELLKRLGNFQMVPGHGPDIDTQTDEELELFVEILESMFEAGQKAKEEN